MNKFDKLLNDVRSCSICATHLPHEPRPVLRAHQDAKLLIVGQAPGSKVHASGIPWDDASGKRLREWLNMGEEVFYDSRRVAIIPMGFCYPGKGKSGDLPPRPECAQTWHQKILLQLKNIRLTLAIGQYAQAYFLGNENRRTLTETVENWHAYQSRHIFPLPHPSPRNNIWLKKNSWFGDQLIPELQSQIAALEL